MPGSADGIPRKDGKRLKLVFQTSVNAVRQDFQALIKQWWRKSGSKPSWKTIDASVFFGGDAGSPDTLQKFYADIEMYANFFEGATPGNPIWPRTSARQSRRPRITSGGAETPTAIATLPLTPMSGGTQRHRRPDPERAELGRTMNDMVTGQQRHHAADLSPAPPRPMPIRWAVSC